MKRCGIGAIVGGLSPQQGVGKAGNASGVGLGVDVGVGVKRKGCAGEYSDEGESDDSDVSDVAQDLIH